MASRRAFLGSLAGTAWIGSSGGFSPELASDAPAWQEPVPPAIAALESMRGEMVPIGTPERVARLAKARRLLVEQRMDAMVLTGGTSLRYFTAIEWGLSERLLAVVVPARGSAFLVCPAFERDRALEQVATGPLGTDAEVMTWEEHEDPYRLLAEGLKARGAATGLIGFEETVRHVFSDGISRALPAARFGSATAVTAGCRMVKGPNELALMRLASRVTLRAYEAAWRSLNDGMTQTQFGSLVRLAHDRLGFSGGAGVQVGPYSALPHGSATPQTIREGTILLIDGGCSVGGYASDISRTFVLGKPTDKMRRVFDIELEAQTVALQAARPGLACGAVDAAARKVIVDAGYGPDYRYFTHRVGHGMGMDGHEWPYLVKDNGLLLEPGMTFSDEPGIYLPGEFGVRLEDDMVITESGAELMTPQSRSLETPFAV
ncbi:MAG: aminopeptidase P family protein [Gemmatimonadetes bacterium]|nr:aminopeptidase P family protein [Gemmatimonadota bacterium]